MVRHQTGDAAAVVVVLAMERDSKLSTFMKCMGTRMQIDRDDERGLPGLTVGPPGRSGNS